MYIIVWQNETCSLPLINGQIQTSFVFGTKMSRWNNCVVFLVQQQKPNNGQFNFFMDITFIERLFALFDRSSLKSTRVMWETIFPVLIEWPFSSLATHTHMWEVNSKIWELGTQIIEIMNESANSLMQKYENGQRREENFRKSDQSKKNYGKNQNYLKCENIHCSLRFEKKMFAIVLSRRTREYSINRLFIISILQRESSPSVPKYFKIFIILYFCLIWVQKSK